MDLVKKLDINQVREVGLAMHKTLLTPNAPQSEGFVLQITVFDFGNKTFRCEHIAFGDLSYNIASIYAQVARKTQLLVEERAFRSAKTSSGEISNPKLPIDMGAIHCTFDENRELYFSISGIYGEIAEALAYVIAENYGMRMDSNYQNLYLDRARELLRGCIAD